MVATKVDQVADVFYVRDRAGQKVEDAQALKNIKEKLLEEIREE